VDCKEGIPFDDARVKKYLNEVKPHGLRPPVGHRARAPVSIGLDYKRDDTLPDLPRLAKSADVGCHFCALLAQAIHSREYSYVARVRIKFTYYWKRENSRGNDQCGLNSLEATLLVLGENGHEDHEHYFTFKIEADRGNSIVFLYMFVCTQIVPLINKS
jgi:hypothetical protein